MNPLATDRKLDSRLVAVVIIFGALCFGLRMTDLTIRGEESRRALVAMEMLRTGDWIVPRLQNELYLSRPPLQNWLIALGGLARGTIDEWAIRWYSCLASILTACLVYWYSRSFLRPATAFVAALSFLTSFQILELGSLGETEALFTLLLSSSLLLWHGAQLRSWSISLQWTVGYLLAALATLTKGPQAPIYFAGCIGLLLLVRRDWRRLFHVGHLLGVGLYLLIVGSWVVPFGMRAGWDAVPAIFMDNVEMRFSHQTSLDLLVHMLTYPFEVLICMLPWSIFLLSYLQRSFRSRLGAASEPLLFCVVVLVVTFPSCWLVPGARGRYYMPIYPFFAPLIAISIQGCWTHRVRYHWQYGWKRLLRSIQFISAMCAAAAIFFVIRPASTHPILEYSRLQWLAMSLTCASIAILMTVCLREHLWRSMQRARSLGAVVPMTVVASFIAIIWNYGWTEILVQDSVTIQQQVDRLRQRLPEDALLVSLDDVDHKFAYYFARPITRIDPDQLLQMLRSRTPSERSRTFICFKQNASRSGAPPAVDWTEVASIPTDRNRSSDEQKRVIIARPSMSANQDPRNSRTVTADSTAVSIADRRPILGAPSDLVPDRSTQ